MALIFNIAGQVVGLQENLSIKEGRNSSDFNKIFVLLPLKTIHKIFEIYPSDAISAGIATAIKPTAAVAVSNEVLTALKKI